MWSIPLSIVAVADLLGSVGLLGLCSAMLDPITFKLILTLTTFCAVGFLLTTVWSVAESLVYRQHKGSKWFWDVLSAHWERTRKLLPFRLPIKIGHYLRSSATFVWEGIVSIMDRFRESVQRFLHPGGNPRTLIPTTVHNNWKTVRGWALGSSTMQGGGDDLEAVHDDDRRAVDYSAVYVTQIDEKESAAHFWKWPHDAEGVLLKAIKTHAHVRAIR